MRLETGPREVDVLLASSTHVGPALSLIDWRTAPSRRSSSPTRRARSTTSRWASG
ncbi:hypothetical protein ACN28S_42755 [Cystobacter fuscus]